MDVVGLLLALLALAIVGYGLSVVWGLWCLRRRRRQHSGVYGVDGLDDLWDSVDEARAAATDAVRHDRIPAPARLLAERQDGGWDVIDEIHVLG